MTTADWIVIRNLALCLGVVATLLFLAVALCREWVKSDLRKRGLQPIHIRWRPFAWRTNGLTCSFRVVCSDHHGQSHRRLCWTQWHRPSVHWEGDDVGEGRPFAPNP